MRSRNVIIAIIVILLIALAVWAFVSALRTPPEEVPPAESPPTVPAPTPPTSGTPSDDVPVRSIEWDERSVVDLTGDTLVVVDDFQTDVQVSEEASFGSDGFFSDVVLSPDGRYLALTISGAAHGFGWLYDLPAEERDPVAFQYGGSLEVVEWSPDDRFVVFRAHSPAETTHLKIVDRENVASYVDETGFTVRVPAEDEHEPPFSYSFQQWRAPHTLCFTFEQEAYCVDAASEELVTE